MPNIITIEAPNLKELQEDFKKVGEEAPQRLKFGLSQFLSMVADTARTTCPVKTGHLQSSITHEITKATKTEVEGRVGSNVLYAPYVELGTGVYGPSKTPIRPKNKKVLAWVSTGARPTTAAGWKQAQLENRAVFAREVRGMRPKPFLLPAFINNLGKLVEVLKKVLS
jgi:HK97 gp10 family phage protein